MIVLIIVDFLQKQALTRCQSYSHRIISVRVWHELKAQLTMANLDYTANHLSDLVKQKGLSLQVEMYEFKCLRILTCWFFIGWLIDVMVLISLQLHHKPLGCHFRWFNVFCIVVILLGPTKCFKQSLKFLLLRVGHSCWVHLFKFFAWDMINVLVYKLFLPVYNVWFICYP